MTWAVLALAVACGEGPLRDAILPDRVVVALAGASPDVARVGEGLVEGRSSCPGA